MNNLDPWYQSLLSLLVSEDQSFSKSDRTGTGTKSLFGVQFRHDMNDGFPLLTTKKMAWKSIVTELLWFLRGDTNIKFLVDNDCNIWNGDAYKNYLAKTDDKNYHATQQSFINHIKVNESFAKEWGELGPIYGKQWRQWQGWIDIPKVHYLAKGSLWYNQIGILIHQLKINPDSRRLMVSAWNVGELDKMVLPPCHYGFQMYTRELSLTERRNLVTPEMHGQIYTGGDSSTLSHSEIDQWSVPKRAISLMWNQRSVDTFLGLPFNIASYGLLLEIIAKEVNMIPEDLIGNLGDVHLYNNHIEQAKEQISRIPFKLPTVHVRDGIESFMPNDIILLDYQSHPSIKAPLSN